MSKTDDERRTRPFADLLLEHNRGSSHRKAGETLQELVGAVLETGKKGTMTVLVTIEPTKNNPDVLQTLITVTSKAPQMPERAAMFWVDEDHNLVAEDPKQEAFEGLKEAPRAGVADSDTDSGPSEVREVPRAAVR